MAIGIASVVGIALRLVSKREQIAGLWGQIVPLVDEIRGDNPGKISKLIDELIPEGELEEGKQQPVYNVEWLQQSLNELGAEPPLTVDGVYGEATMDAVMDYQKDHHPPLTADGWAGVQTQAAIAEDLSTL